MVERERVPGRAGKWRLPQEASLCQSESMCQEGQGSGGLYRKLPCARAGSVSERGREVEASTGSFPVSGQGVWLRGTGKWRPNQEASLCRSESMCQEVQGSGGLYRKLPCARAGSVTERGREVEASIGSFPVLGRGECLRGAGKWRLSQEVSLYPRRKCVGWGRKRVWKLLSPGKKEVGLGIWGGLVGKDAAVPQVSSASGYAGWNIFLKKGFIIPS